MGFFENWKKKREEQARKREELQAELEVKREKDKRSQEVLLNLNVEITNAALRETERERTKELSSHYQDQMVRRVNAIARTMFLATTDMIGGARIKSQLLASHLGGTGEPGDFAIFCIYVAAVIKKCADILATSHREGKYSIKSPQGPISASHGEIVTALDTTLASSLRRVEEILSDRHNDPGDYLRRVLVSAVNQYGHEYAGPIAAKAFTNLKANSSTASF
jgi:hypothetical protein